MCALYQQPLLLVKLESTSASSRISARCVLMPLRMPSGETVGDP